MEAEYPATESSYITELRYKRDETYEAYAGSEGLRPRRRGALLPCLVSKAPPATLRVSQSAYHTMGEVEVFADTMDQLLEHFT